MVATLCGDGVRDIGGYHFREGAILGEQGIIARTGYTGEDGFEIVAPAANIEAVWNKILAAGHAHCCQPAGLGAQPNTFR